MKKWIAALLSALLILGATACGGGEKKTEGDKPTSGQSANKESAAKPTAEELIQKAADASKSVKSYSKEIEIKQTGTSTIKGEKQDLKQAAKLKADFIKDPLQTYQEIKMSGTNQKDQEAKRYITNDGIYEYEREWRERPNKDKEEQMADLLHLEKPLEKVKDVAKDIKIAEEGNDYILTAELSGNDQKDLIKSHFEQFVNVEKLIKLVEKMDIKTAKFKYAIHKNTFLPTKYETDLTLNLEEKEETFSGQFTITNTISKHNEVGEIKVPQEVLDAVK